MKHKTTIFHRTNKPTKQELQNITEYYNKLTSDIDNDFAMGKLDSPDEWHYSRLLKIADYKRMGKSFAILTAWKLGYIAGMEQSGMNKAKPNTEIEGGVLPQSKS